MTSDLDIYQSANLLVKQHGPDAPIHAAMRADAMLEKGDLDGAAVCTVTPAGRSLDSNSSTAFTIRFHTAHPSRSPLSSMASARIAAWIGASSPCCFTSVLALR